MRFIDNKALNILIVINIFALIVMLLVILINGLSVSGEKITASDIDTHMMSQQNSDAVNQSAVAGKDSVTLEAIKLKTKLKILKTAPSNKFVSSKKATEINSVDDLSNSQHVAGDSKNREKMFDAISTRIYSQMLDEQTGGKRDSTVPNASVLLRNEVQKKQREKIKLTEAEIYESEKEKESAEINEAEIIFEAEEISEVRTIKVRAGESLWEVAIRAYGNASMYKKILKENPKLSGPNSIVSGKTLRVPL